MRKVVGLQRGSALYYVKFRSSNHHFHFLFFQPLYPLTPHWETENSNELSYAAESSLLQHYSANVVLCPYSGMHIMQTGHIFNCIYPNRLLSTGNVENFPRIKRTEREAFYLNANSIQINNAYNRLFIPKTIIRK